MNILVKKDHSYSLCPCGRSKKYPFCDGSHKGTEMKPVRFKADKDQTIQFQNGKVEDA